MTCKKFLLYFFVVFDFTFENNYYVVLKSPFLGAYNFILHKVVVKVE